MDLIYTDKERNDVGVMKGYTFDLAFGVDENDFELTLDAKDHCCDVDCLVYIEGTDYGGIIDGVNITTADEKLTYKGRTWQGVLASKVIEPNSGTAYLTVTGEANRMVKILLGRLGLSDLFVASDVDSGLIIDNYSFDRYVDGYSGLTKMVSTVDAKLKFTFRDGKVVVSVLPIVDHSQNEQFDNDNVEMQVDKTRNTVNHLICLGQGELTGRQVVHLYMDADGNVSETQTFFGLQEITAVYDYPNAESLGELKKGGTERLKEYATNDKVELNLTSEGTYDVGDIISAKEIITNTFAKERITKKIVTINQGVVNIEYKVGE